MRKRLVRLKLPPRLLAHIELLELRQHLKAEVSKFLCGLLPRDTETLLDDLVFLLNSPLFLYAIGPRVRSANSRLHDSKHDASKPPEPTTIEARHLSIAIEHHDGCCSTQLRYAASVLIDARELISAGGPEAEQVDWYRRCLRWFCDEVGFLGYEYRAREEAAAAILGRGLVKNIRSKVVKLQVSQERLVALRAKKYGRMQKERRMKPKLKLWKDAADG